MTTARPVKRRTETVVVQGERQRKRSDVRGLWRWGEGRTYDRAKGGSLTQFRHWIPTEIVKALRAKSIADRREQKDLLIDALTAYLGSEKIAAQGG